MGTLHLFTGANQYALSQAKKGWIAEFIRKHGDDNLLRLDGKNLAYKSLLNEVSTAPFIASKRLVVIEGIPSLSKEEVDLLVQSQHPDCVLLIVDPKPDRRFASTKAFLDLATVKTFEPLKLADVSRWLHAFVGERGGSLQADALQELLSQVGDDQQQLVTEVEKVLLYARGKPVTLDHVRALTVPSGEREVWHLTDLLVQGQRREAFQYTRELLQRGDDASSVWAVLLWMLKNLVFVHAAARGGMRQPGSIASEFGVPFPSVRALLPHVPQIDEQRLADLLDWAAEADVLLKSGGYRATGDAQQEQVCLIDELLLRGTGLRAQR